MLLSRAIVSLDLVKRRADEQSVIRRRHGGMRSAFPPTASRRIEAFVTGGGAQAPTFRKRNWPNPKARPSLNREASRLGDVRRRRRTLSPLIAGLPKNPCKSSGYR